MHLHILIEVECTGKSFWSGFSGDERETESKWSRLSGIENVIGLWLYGLDSVLQGLMLVTRFKYC